MSELNWCAQIRLDLHGSPGGEILEHGVRLWSQRMHVLHGLLLEVGVEFASMA